MNLKPTRHDIETILIVFVAAMCSALSQSASFDTAALFSAVSAGLTAVAHKFLTKE